MNKLFTVLLIAFILFAYSCNNPSAKVDETVNETVETIETLSEKIRENPENANLFVKRSDLQLEADNLDEAISDLVIALKVDSLLPDVYVKLSSYYMVKGKSGDAKEALLKCLDLFPTNHEARLNLSQIYFFVQMYQEAMREIVTLEQNNLQSTDSYLLKGLILNETEAYDKATKALKKAIEFDNENWEAYNLMGMIYYRLSDPIAIEYFKTAIKLFPNNLEIRFNAGLVFQEFDLFDEAISEYDYIISVDNMSYQAYYNSGYVYVTKLKDYEKAVESFSFAIKSDSSAFKAYYNRGFSYELMGKFKLAELDYRKALEILPNYDLAVQGLNEVIAKQ